MNKENNEYKFYLSKKSPIILVTEENQKAPDDCIPINGVGFIQFGPKNNDPLPEAPEEG